MAGELFDIVNSLWGEDENLTYEGRVSPCKLEIAWITPKPLYGRPVLVNATGSPSGIDFAVRYSDLVFITSPGDATIEQALESLPAHIAPIKDAAKAAGRTIKVLINPAVVSRDTSEETAAYLKAVVDAQGDAPEGKRVFGAKYDSDAHAWKARKGDSSKPGYNLGGSIEVIGTPKEVVEQLAALHRVGIDGVQLGFLDCEVDFDHFTEKVLPLPKEAGLRVD